eukprot:g42113.t1
MLPVFYQDLINVWNMGNLHWVFPASGVEATLSILHHRGFEWLAEGRAVAAGGVTRVGDVPTGRGQGWMLLQELASRAAVDIQLMADAFRCLKKALLGPDLMCQLGGCSGMQWNPVSVSMLLIFAHPVRRGVRRLEDLLMALVLGLARLAI